MTILTILFIGILLGIMMERYIFPIFDTLLDIFSIKQSKIATKDNIFMQKMNLDLMRDYPELTKEDMGQEQVHAIGFQYESDYEDEYYENDE